MKHVQRWWEHVSFRPLWGEGVARHPRPVHGHDTPRMTGPSEAVWPSGGIAQLRREEAAVRRQLADCADPRRRALLHNQLGRLLYGQVRFDEAVEQYTMALAAWPRLAAAAHNRATISYRMGRFRDAERDLMAALQLEPDNPEVAIGLRETRRLLADQRSLEQDQGQDQEHGQEKS